MSRIKVTKSQSKSSIPYVGTLERNKKFKGTTPGRVQKAGAPVFKPGFTATGKKPELHGKNEAVLGTFNKGAKAPCPMEEHPRFEKKPGQLAYGFKNAGPNK